MSEILTVKEVSDYLRLSRATVWRWCNDGTLPAFKVGRGWRVHRGDVEKLLAQGVATPRADPEPDMEEGDRYALL
jgi:excisionase family DNA binding protein